MPDSLYGLIFLVLSGLGGYIVKGIRSDGLAVEVKKLKDDSRAEIASVREESEKELETFRLKTSTELEELRAVVKHLDHNLHSALNEKAELWKQIASLQERDAIREQEKSTLALSHLDEKRMREDLEAQLSKARAELERSGQTIRELSESNDTAQKTISDLRREESQREKANAYLQGKNDGLAEYIRSFQITAVTTLVNPIPEEENKPDGI